MKNRSFVLKPPVDNLFLEATWNSQQLGCGWEEFALGAVLAPCSWLSPGLLTLLPITGVVHILDVTAMGPWDTRKGGAGNKQPLPVIQWPAAYLQ